MKRIIALLSITAVLLSLAACSKAPADDGKTTTTGVTTTTASGQDDGGATTQTTTTEGSQNHTTTTAEGWTGEATTTDGSHNGTTSVTEDDTPVQGTTSAPTTTNGGEIQGATMPPTTTTTTTAQVILDGDEEFVATTVVDTAAARVTITAIEEDGEMGYTLHARFENLTKDTDCLFAVDTAAVNGVLIEPLFVTEVTAGESYEDSIILCDIVPEGVDIGEYTDIMLVFTVSDVDDWEAPPLAEKAAHLYPKGADKVTTYRHTAESGEHVLMENKYVTVIAVNSAEDTKWGGYYSNLYFLNKTAEPLLFSIDEATVNSFGVEPYFATYLLPGYAAFGKVEWLKSSLADSHIDKVEKLEFLLSVYREVDWENVPEEDWEDAVLVSEEIRYTP